MLPEDTMSDESLERKTKKLSPEEAAKEVIEAEAERVKILDKLADRITNKFIERAKKRTSKELEWLRAERLFNAPLLGGNEDLPDRPFDPKRPTISRPEPNIVRTKCETAIANCVSLQFGAGEKNWDLFPPANSTDPAIAEACRLMEKEIETQLSNTHYGRYSRRAMEDRVKYGSGVLKGPVNVGRMEVEYVQDATGEWLPEVTQTKSPKMAYVPVWRFYPDMSVTDFEESEDAIEINPMSVIELSQYRKHPGFDKEAIDAILKGTESRDAIRPEQYNEDYLKIPVEVWGRNPYLYKERFVIIEYHGPITYDEANKLGLTPTYESPTQEYYGEVWVCAGKVIRMELENIEGHAETPYSMSIWKRDPSSPFGFGHPLLLADAQRVVTQAYHMILDNASISSAPQVAMYHKFIQPVDGDYTLSPGKVWMMTDPSQTVDNAIKFFYPPNVIENIMPVLNLARQFAEEESATADFGGKQSPQNVESATGQLLMQHASTVLLDFLAEEWDEQVTEKVIRRMYAWNMQYNSKPEIKGNYAIDVRSSSEYKNKQMYIRDLERLSVEVTQNPEMAMMINVPELVRARLSTMHLPSNRIIRSLEEIAQAQQQAANQPDPEMIELQIKQQELALKKQELDLRTAQLRFELGQQQQREMWEHEEKMGANEARLRESEAQVLKARSEVQVEMIKLAQNDEQMKLKLQSDNEMMNLKIQSQVFLKSMEEARKAQENSLHAEEMKLRRQTGQGV